MRDNSAARRQQIIKALLTEEPARTEFNPRTGNVELFLAKLPPSRPDADAGRKNGSGIKP